MNVDVELYDSIPDKIQLARVQFKNKHTNKPLHCFDNIKLAKTLRSPATSVLTVALNMLHHFLVKVITVWMHLRLMLVDGSGRLVFPGAVRKFPECFVNVKLHLFRVCHAVFLLCRGTCQRQR